MQQQQPCHTIFPRPCCQFRISNSKGNDFGGMQLRQATAYLSSTSTFFPFLEVGQGFFWPCSAGQSGRAKIGICGGKMKWLQRWKVATWCLCSFTKAVVSPCLMGRPALATQTVKNKANWQDDCVPRTYSIQTKIGYSFFSN